MLIDPAKLTTIQMVIIQPRINNVSEWEISINKLLDFAGAAEEAIEKAEEAKAYWDEEGKSADEWANLYLQPSEKGCKWCKAKGNCPALAAECMQELAIVADIDGLPNLEENLPKAIDEGLKLLPALDFETVVKLYSAIDKIELWVEAIRARTMYDMLNGRKHDDFKLVKGKAGHRKWKDELQAEKFLKALRFKKEEMFDMKVISPTSAEKLLKDKPRALDKLGDLVTRNDGKITIAPRSDKRPPLDPFNDQVALLPDLTLDDIC